MAKDKERQLAYYYFVEKNRSAKETAILCAVTEATLSGWVRKFGWKAMRDARAMSAGARMDNIRSVIDEMAAQRVALSGDLDLAIAQKDLKRTGEIRQELAQIDNGVAMWNKSLATATKEGKITLTNYLEVMDSIFNALRNFNESIYLKTIDFQQQHIHEVSTRQ